MNEKSKKFYDTPAQKEAYLNEYKGNLFEYLVALEIAKQKKIEADFVINFPDFLKVRFRSYEEIIRSLDIELYTSLPLLAKTTSKKIIEKINLSKLSKIRVVGKDTDSRIKESYHEGDILLCFKERIKPLSLKLCKDCSFINTKSGGVRSFFIKYFNNIKNINLLQNKLNDVLDKSFQRMGHSLYEIAGLEFLGHFDQNWIDHGFSELPGRLDLEMSKIVQKNYYETINCMYEIFLTMSKEKEVFCRSLLPLLGMGNDQMVQVMCLYKNSKKSRYDSSTVHIINYETVYNELSSMKILNASKGKSSFEISFKTFNLQIRIKPMNKFTTPSYKVNCSVKIER